MRRVLPGWLLLAALASPGRAAAEPRRPVRSMLELRRDGVVRQGWDLSCGAAALGTLLALEHGDRVDEGEIVAALLPGVDAERIRRDGGFSLLDLKRYAVARGYAAAGYARLDLARLAALAPAIVPTVVDGAPHFVVFRGVAGARVLVADPAYGNRTLRAREFEALWSPRVAFVVSRPGSPRAAPGPEAAATSVPGAAVRGVAGWTP